MFQADLHLAVMSASTVDTIGDGRRYRSGFLKFVNAILCIHLIPLQKMSDQTMQASTSGQSAQLPINLFTRSQSDTIPASTYFLPAQWRRFQLSELINKVLHSPTPVPFDFLINGEVLRTSLEAWVKKNRGGDEEGTIDVEYVRSVMPPEEVGRVEQEDWVSGLSLARSGCVDHAFSLMELHELITDTFSSRLTSRMPEFCPSPWARRALRLVFTRSTSLTCWALRAVLGSPPLPSPPTSSSQRVESTVPSMSSRSRRSSQTSRPRRTTQQRSCIRLWAILVPSHPSPPTNQARA